MRIGIITIVMLTTTMQLFSASPVKSQSINNVHINLEVKNESLEGIFKKIEKRSPFYFMYRNDDINSIHKLSYKANNRSVEEVLENLLSDTYLTFKQVDNRILIEVRARDKTNADKKLYQLNIVADSIVTGKITDSKGEALPGIIVKVKESNVSTVTNVSGNYRLNLPAGSKTLIVSYLGYTTQEIPINGRSNINATLVEATTTLNDVVVVGYGTVRRSDLVGSASSVSIKDIKNQPAARVDEVLQGRSSGVAVQNTSASPNGAITIRIRGSNSINGSNDPLVVIDGFLGGDLSSINPNDIASIEVLKDASSTAIYGSRGANGVILVTTKSGASGGTTVQYNDYFNFQKLRKKIDLLNAAQYAQTVNANRSDLGLAQPFTASQIAGFQANGGTDWQNEIFRPALQQSHQLSIAGGSDKVSYYISGNFVNNEGILKGSSFRRYTIRSNTESHINKKITVGANLFLSQSTDHPVLTGANLSSLGLSQDNSPVQSAEIFAPTLPVYNANGSYSLPSSAYGPPAVNNPLALAIEPIRNNDANRTELNTYLNYNIVKGLTAKVLFGARLLDQQNSFYYNTKPQGGTGLAQAGITNSRDWILQNTNQINYQTAIATNHVFNLTAVYETQTENFNSSFAGSNGFSSDLLTYNNLALGTAPQIPTSTQTKKVIQSLVGRLNYAYKDRYLLSVTSRYDGSSVFGENHKWGYFPSAAVAWRVNNESFMKNVTQISDLKFRTSYGLTGSQAVGPYSSLAQLNTNSPYPINGSTLATGVGLGTVANPDLKWEKTAQFDAGFDLGLFSNRIEFTADYYNKITSDLLLNVPLPLTSGYTSVLKNIGKVQNQGIELNLGGNPLIGKFKWNTNLNFAVNKNKVLALAGTNEISLGGPGFPNFGNTIFLDVGQPIGVLKGYIQNGIWGTAEAAQATKYGTIPGAPKYIDENNDGKINSADIATMGTTLPKFTYGWSNTFTYKNIDLNVLIQGSQGNKIYNLSRVRTERSSSDADATDVRILNRWTPTNQNTNVPSFLGSNQYEQIQSSRWLEDGSYVRLKTITLGYSLPMPVLKKLKIKSARIFVSGVNLLTITKYTGYDPEAATNVGTLGGIDVAAYPSQKTYSIGVNVTL